MLKGDEVGLDTHWWKKKNKKEQLLLVEHSAVLLLWVQFGLTPAGTRAGNTDSTCPSQLLHLFH